MTYDTPGEMLRDLAQGDRWSPGDWKRLLDMGICCWKTPGSLEFEVTILVPLAHARRAMKLLLAQR